MNMHKSWHIQKQLLCSSSNSTDDVQTTETMSSDHDDNNDVNDSTNGPEMDCIVALCAVYMLGVMLLYSYMDKRESTNLPK